MINALLAAILVSFSMLCLAVEVTRRREAEVGLPFCLFYVLGTATWGLLGLQLESRGLIAISAAQCTCALLLLFVVLLRGRVK